MERAQLIERKHQVIAEIQRTRSELERAQVQGSRWHKWRIRALEQRLDSLMSEEYRLRQEIDRSR